jgi:hypothetical protein
VTGFVMLSEVEASEFSFAELTSFGSEFQVFTTSVIWFLEFGFWNLELGFCIFEIYNFEIKTASLFV